MVHVLRDVLKKIHETLRDHGVVLILQPAMGNAIVELIVDGVVKLNEELQEPNFKRFLRATKSAIEVAVAEELFAVEGEVIVPADENYSLVDEYESIDKWFFDHEPFCEDWGEMKQLADKLHTVTNGKPHLVRCYWRENRMLLRKRS